MTENKASWEYGQVVISERHEYEIKQADDEVLVSLELLPKADPRGFKVTRDEITLGTSPWVTYRVVGWHTDACALICERVWE